MKVTKKINLEQLDFELNGEGLNAVLDGGEIVAVLLTENNTATEAQLKSAIESHIALDYDKAAARAAVYAKLGLNADEAALLLQ